MFGCRENQKEFLHLFHKETHENPNDLNPITPAKDQGPKFHHNIAIKPKSNFSPKKKKPSPVIQSKFSDPLATTKGFPLAK